MAAFSTNPILFKIKYINRDRIDTTTNISSIIGKAFHRAMEVYYSPESPKEEGKAIELALSEGLQFMREYPEGFINWSSKIDNRQKAMELVSFAILEYVKVAKRDEEETISCEEGLISNVDIDWRGQHLALPVALKGYTDRITRDKEGRLKIRDYKTCDRFSDLDKIDGGKILQAVEYYLLVHARYGEAPYSLIYEEVKTSKNSDGKPQVREYEIVFEENEIYFDFYFRFYEDMIRALNGEMVFVPNIWTFFDNEVSIVSYIQRLDVTEEAAKLMKEHQVTTLTDLLKKEINTAANMRKLLEGAADKFIQEKSIDYQSMTPQDKIKAKLMEQGIVLSFDSVVEGASVDLYRFLPTVGVKMSKIRACADDIQQILGAESVRVLAPIKGTTFVGFEVPRGERRFPVMPAADGFNLAIGETVDGQIRRFDLREAPHMLVAGSTGSGKSVFLHGLIQQLLTIPGIELHLYDPKRVELARYEESAKEYLTEAEDITTALAYLVDEMDRRYDALKAIKARDISGMPELPHKIIVIDEYADIAARQSGNKDRSTAATQIQLLAQKGRAAGIHIILATQRASTQVITGDVKVNFPVKAVFRMAKGVDSRVMLDEEGAERLLGKGDMLFATESGMERLQGFKAV